MSDSKDSNPAGTVLNMGDFFHETAKNTMELTTRGTPMGSTVKIVMYTSDGQSIIVGTVASSTIENNTIPQALSKEIGAYAAGEAVIMALGSTPQGWVTLGVAAGGALVGLGYKEIYDMAYNWSKDNANFPRSIETDSATQGAAPETKQDTVGILEGNKPRARPAQERGVSSDCAPRRLCRPWGKGQTAAIKRKDLYLLETDKRRYILESNPGNPSTWRDVRTVSEDFYFTSARAWFTQREAREGMQYDGRKDPYFRCNSDDSIQIFKFYDRAVVEYFTKGRLVIEFKNGEMKSSKIRKK